MKTLSFYNSKGGVGKTLLTIMMASWLYYHLRLRVLVIDTETPRPRIYDYREFERKLAGDPKSPFGKYIVSHPEPQEPYDIARFDPTERFSDAYLSNILEETRGFLLKYEKNYDYVLFDFPATFIRNTPSYAFISSGLIDLVAVPINIDTSSFLEGVATAQEIKELGNEAVLFWNNISKDDENHPTRLISREAKASSLGLEFLPERVRSFTKADRDSDTALFVKSTLCWPERYVEIFAPTIPALFIKLKDMLDSIESSQHGQ